MRTWRNSKPLVLSSTQQYPPGSNLLLHLREVSYVLLVPLITLSDCSGSLLPPMHALLPLVFVDTNSPMILHLELKSSCMQLPKCILSLHFPQSLSHSLQTNHDRRRKATYDEHKAAQQYTQHTGPPALASLPKLPGSGLDLDELCWASVGAGRKGYGTQLPSLEA